MRKAAKTAAIMAVLIFGEKVIAFIRELLTANFFGTSYIVDAYVIANNIPGIIFAGIFSSIGAAFLPLYSEIIEKNGRKEGDRFVSETIIISSGIAFIIAVFGVIFAAPLVSVLAYGFSGKTAELTVFFIRITFSYIVFMAISAIFESYLQYHSIFIRPVLATYFQSICMISAIIAAAYIDFRLLPLGLVIGHFLRVSAIGIVAKKEGFLFRPGRKIYKTAKKFALLALPVFIGSTVNQINTLVDKLLATGLNEGTVSGLNYGNLLVQTINALTITVIVTIIYPRLTKAIARDDYPHFNDSIGKGMNILLMINVPITVGILLYSKPIISMVFERGAFDQSSTLVTSESFFFYSFSLTFLGINMLILKVFYAMQDMKTPVICGIVGAVVNIVLNLLLVGIMQHKGLALATSIASLVNAVMLILLLKEKHKKVKVLTSIRDFVVIAILGVGVCLLSLLVYYPLLNMLRYEISLIISILFVVIIYIPLLKICKIEEINMLTDMIKRRSRN